MEFSHWFHKWCKSTSEHRSLYVTSFTICWLILNFIQGYFTQVVPQCEQLQTGLLPWKNGDLIGYDFSFSRVLCSRMFTRCPNHICICTIGIGRFFYLIYVEVYNYDTLKIEMNLVLWTCDWVISYMLYLWTSVLHSNRQSVNLIQWTTRITETGITNLTRITNEMATSSDYLIKYFNGFLAVLLE